MMIPLYSFVHGDSIGMIVLIDSTHSVRELAIRAQRAAEVRVAANGELAVYFRGERLPAELTIVGAGLSPLDRIDLVPAAEAEP